MRILFASLMVSLWGAAALVVASDASTVAATGDTCIGTGSGTAYTLTITIPLDAPAQAGFAFGASGVTVTNVTVAGGRGTFSSQNLPASMTGGWMMPVPSLTGSVVAKVVTSGQVKNSFTVVPAGATGGPYFDSINCPISSHPLPLRGFVKVQPKLDYQPALGTWRQVVTVSGPGRVLFRQGVAHNSPATTPTGTSLVRSGTVAVKRAGRVTLTLRPTEAGRARLKATHMIKLRLSITFESSTGATPATKVINVTLRTSP